MATDAIVMLVSFRATRRVRAALFYREEAP